MHTLQQLLSGDLAGVRRLDLSCGLTEFPEAIFSLADSLEVLNLSGNALSWLPDGLARLPKLRVLFCSHNRFTQLPPVLSSCRQLETVGFRANQIARMELSSWPPALRALILTDNRIERVPASLGTAAQLQKLMLSGNRLRTLPEALSACRRLELLRVAANGLRRLPDWLADMPRLAWLACGGNPFSDGADSDLADDPCQIDWSGLTLGEKIGEGASGVIHQATWQRGIGEVPQPVAVKLFKGDITSDGLPNSEMAAHLRAGRHAHLIGAEGRIVGHPDDAPGLVMPLIDASFKVLAGPPSLASCTRDVYPPETCLTPALAWRLALGVADAMAHLHQRSILHGDLYAHNILWRPEGEVRLGDFGAAALLPRRPGLAPSRLLRLEVMAFACLLKELQAGCVAPGAASTLTLALSALAQGCAAEPSARPTFSDIHATLCDIGAAAGLSA